MPAQLFKSAIKILVCLFLGVGWAVESSEAPRFLQRRESSVQRFVRKSIGRVVKVSGPGFIKRAGKKQQVSVSLGMSLFIGDRVIAERGKLYIHFEDGSRMVAAPGTELESERFGIEGEKVFRFFKGVLHITTPSKPSNHVFVLHTAHGFIQVTDPSEFFLEQKQAERELFVHIIQGKMEWIGDITNDRVTLNKNTTAHLAPHGFVHYIGLLAEEDLRRLKSDTEI